MSNVQYQIQLDIYNPHDQDFAEQMEIHKVKLVTQHWIGNTYDCGLQGSLVNLRKFLRKAYITFNSDDVALVMHDAIKIK